MDDLNENLTQKTTVSNAIVKEEYQKIRQLIAMVIMETGAFKIEQLSSDFTSLDKLRKDARDNETRVGESISEWIVEGKIQSKYVSSLLNDSHYCYNICRNLGQVTIKLFSGDLINHAEVTEEPGKLEEVAEDE